MTTWKKEIDELNLKEPLLDCTLTEEELNEEFDDSFGGHEGKSFTAWTENYVIFPVVYDGAEWADCAPRNPCNKATSHVGGE